MVLTVVLKYDIKALENSIYGSFLSHLKQTSLKIRTQPKKKKVFADQKSYGETV